MPSKIKVFHLEDYTIIRDGIRFLLNQDHEIELTGEAQSGEELLQMLSYTEVNILLLDIYLDGMEDTKAIDGFEVCKKVTEGYPEIKVIAHSVYDDADRVARIMKAGAQGFVSKKAGYAELIHAIKVVNNGEKYICEETAKKLKNLNKFLSGIETTLESSQELFSRREKEVLELLAKGLTSREIARQLFITEKTVESHRKNLVLKAKVKNTNELIAFAFGRGFIKN